MPERDWYESRDWTCPGWTCLGCKGTGKCEGCLLDQAPDCFECSGSGICIGCDGTGKVRRDVFIDLTGTDLEAE